jgi:hypothetical protein
MSISGDATVNNNPEVIIGECQDVFGEKYLTE